MRSLACFVAVASLGFAGSLWADTVEIAGGGHVAGKVERIVTDTKMPFVVVALDDDLKIAVQRTLVRRITTDDKLAQYRQKRDAAGVDPEEHYKLAIWCEGNNMTPHKRFHMQRTIALDPDHSKARASLRYVRVEGSNEWILYSDQQRNRGLILKNNRWVLPEAVAREEQREKAEKEAKLWVKRIARLRSTATNPRRNGDKAIEALDEIRAIKDPLAAEAVAKELLDSRGNQSQSQELRKIWVQLLGRFHNTTAVAALVATGIDEPNNIIREAALDQLQDYGRESAIATYLPMLDPAKAKNPTVKKALRALSYFPDRSLAMKYVDALVTTHLTQPAQGPGLSVGRSSNGGGGLAMGGNKKPIPRDYRNPMALTLLKEVEPGVDFGYDQQAWREHFAAQLTTYEGDLRRDP